ncbi:MAG: histidine phosphotransferase [Hyphococcus sp.]|nr:MAG: histidine phosphotransferase [Marinicaulis sp.]
MSHAQEAAPVSSTDQADESELDAVALSALISSRVCHDLINPVGAIGSGLEVLDDPAMEETMRDAALTLIRSGAKKALALLSYARLAYGSAGGFGAQISMEDAQKALTELYDTTKADLDWQIGGGLAAKENVKALMVLAYAAADCIPRGGTVSITGDISDFEITASGKKLLLQDDLVRALNGDATELAPKFTPALLVHKLVTGAKGKIAVEKSEEKVTFKAAFSA